MSGDVIPTNTDLSTKQVWGRFDECSRSETETEVLHRYCFEHLFMLIPNISHGREHFYSAQ